MTEKKFRLVTRSDFDGLVCGVLLKELDLIDEVKFVHPKDMQDGVVHITDRDITANVPYVEGCHLAFDHHLSETMRVGANPRYIVDAEAPSAARVVYEYYGGRSRFANVPDDLMAAVDQGDSARYEIGEVLAPKGWALLNFLLDARTGLGRFRDFRISNYQLMMDLIDRLGTMTLDDVLEHPDVKERADLYFEHEPKFKEQLKRCSTIHGNVVILDLRPEETIWAGNRFMIYALFPNVNVSIHALWGLEKKRTVFAVGKSIFNRTSRTDIGPLMLTYGGGGHAAAGTCQVDNADAERVLAEIVARLRADG
jgi:nanoRNase/pAp phosphatase (c-di-AMP/oligoRNAs hydrolase)